MAGIYRFPTAWQDEHPFGSGAHWEVGWSEDQLSFFARLIEEYSEDEIEAGLLPEAAEPVFSYARWGSRGRSSLGFDPPRGRLTTRAGTGHLLPSRPCWPLVHEGAIPSAP